MQQTKFVLLSYVLAVYFLYNVSAIPKYSAESKNYADNKWNRGYYNENKTELDESTAATKERLQRLGYSTGYGAINNYGTGLSAYNPIKLDLGGVVLGTLVGIGAIIIIPKLLHAFSGGYSGYGRSEDNELSSLTGMMNKIDDILSQNNIDSTSCIQRAVCNYIRSTEGRRRSGSADQIDELVHTLTGNSLVDYFLEGSAVKEAMEKGKQMNDKSCEQIYTSCPANSAIVKTVTETLLNQTNN